MPQKIFYLFFTYFLLSLFSPISISASNHLDCEITDLSATSDYIDQPSDPQKFDAMACLGGFASEEAAGLPITVKIECLAKTSFLGNETFCDPLHPFEPTILKQETVIPDFTGGEDTNGDGRIDNYYTCFVQPDLPREAARMRFSFDTHEGVCSTEDINIRPVNLDVFGEFWLRPIGGEGPEVKSPLCVDGKINTAIGCIDYNIIGLTRFILGWSLGVGGGVALVLIGYGGIMFMLSQGNPDRVNEAKSILTAAISGLLLIIFSTFLLRLIGVNILELF